MTEKKIRDIIAEEIKKSQKPEGEDPVKLTKQVLERYSGLTKSIHVKLEAIEELKSSKPSVRSPSTAERVQGGKVDFLSYTEKTDEVISHLMKEVEEIRALKAQVDAILKALKAEEGIDLLLLRYADKMTFKEIASEAEMAETTVRRKVEDLVAKVASLLFPLKN